ncbi:lysis inhibition [Morganella phage vB_Mm5]
MKKLFLVLCVIVAALIYFIPDKERCEYKYDVYVQSAITVYSEKIEPTPENSTSFYQFIERNWRDCSTESNCIERGRAVAIIYTIDHKDLIN